MACDPGAVRLSQYQVQGERLYQQYCSNCHQADGNGLAKLYPPVRNVQYTENKKAVACAIRYGLDEPIEINGIVYHQPMPAAGNLTELEIAELVTFLTTRWGNGKEIVETKEIQELLKNCGKE